MSNTSNYHHPLPISQTHHTSKRGFTIVELLIVIVVVAILAAISIVSYNGIQQRANNTAIINAASQSLKLIQGYIAANDKYPTNSGVSCISSESGCYRDVANAAFDKEISTIGVLPRSIPKAGDTRYGMFYQYASNRTMNGVSRPAVIYYYLQGSNQQCGLSNIVQIADWTNNVMVSSPYGNTLSNDYGTTLCYVSVPGPEAA